MIPSEIEACKKINKQMGTVSDKVDASTGPKSARDSPNSGKQDGNGNRGQHAMRGAAVNVFAEEQLRKKIKIGKVGDKDKRAELAKPLKPLPSKNRRPACDKEERPKSGETMRNW